MIPSSLLLGGGAIAVQLFAQHADALLQLVGGGGGLGRISLALRQLGVGLGLHRQFAPWCAAATVDGLVVPIEGVDQRADPYADRGELAGRIAAERRAIAVDDIDSFDIYNPILREKGLRSLLGALTPFAGAGR